jgi:hypothetical protein
MARISIVWAFLLAAGAIAQPASPPEAAEPSPAPEFAAAVPATPAPLLGDTIHFKSGGMLCGVQVLREKLDVFEVEVLEGVEPITIPREQVDRIEYDDIDILRERRHKQLLGNGASGGDVVQGEEVAVELFEKLTATLPAEPISYENKDFIEILNDLAEQFQFKLEIAEPVKQIPVEERTISLETRPGSTLVNVLRTSLLERFPSLEMTYKFDTVVISVRGTEGAAEQPPATESPEPNAAPVGLPQTPQSDLGENRPAGPEAGGDTAQ